MSKERVLGYVRVSTETQEKKGYGLQAQEKAIKDYCKKEGLELIQVFKDEGVSGTAEERQGLENLIATLGDIRKVVVLNTSRLWRSDFASVFVKRAFIKAKADIISVEQPTYSIYAKDPNDVLVNGMLELLDQYDRMSISGKLARGRLTKAKDGYKPGGIAPYGYRWHHGGGEKPEVVVDNEKAEIVRKIFAKYLECGSIYAVRKYLNGHCMKSPRGKQFTDETVKNILTNDFYLGFVRHAGERIKGKHAPIISPVIFGKVRKQLERNAEKYSSKSA